MLYAVGGYNNGPTATNQAFTPDLDNDSGFSQLNGGNTFTGNQNVNGNVTAANFMGNGSGLTGVAAATANTANFATTANFANTAGLATNAGTATNALSLGNVLAANYARLDIDNNLVGNQAVTGNLSASGNLSAIGSASLGGPVKIGGGTAIVKHLSMTISLTVSALKPSTCSFQGFAFAGASDGDTIALGIPNAMMVATGIPSYSAWVASANAILIRACNLDPNVNQKTAASGTIRVDIWKH